MNIRQSALAAYSSAWEAPRVAGFGLTVCERMRAEELVFPSENLELRRWFCVQATVRFIGLVQNP